MLKIIGLTIVFACALGMGSYSAALKKTSLKQFEELLRFSKHIRLKINYFNAPLESIYSSFVSETKFMNDFLANLRETEWINAMKETQDLCLNKQHIQIFSELGNILGKTPKDEQLTQIDYYLNILDKEFEKLKKDTPEKAKLTFSFWVYGGLLLIILFL